MAEALVSGFSRESGEAMFLVLEWPLGPGQNADCRKGDMTIPRTLAFDPEIYPNESMAEFHSDS